MQKLIEMRDEAVEIIKLAARALFNWAYHTRLVTATHRDADGFHLYEYEGTPSVAPGMFVVRYRHIRNGEVRTNKRIRMTHREWLDTVKLMENANGEVA